MSGFFDSRSPWRCGRRPRRPGRLVADDLVVAAAVRCRSWPRRRSSSGRRCRCPCRRGSPGRGCSRPRRPCRRRGRAARWWPSRRRAWPRSTRRSARRPAKLSVANVMSTASAGSGGVSSAITKRPASRAFSRASSTAGPLGVMRMPFVALGDGVLDGLDLGVLVAVLLAGGDREVDAQLLGGGFLAPSCMATKNGLVVVLTISETPTSDELARAGVGRRTPRAPAWMPARQPRRLRSGAGGQMVFSR